MGKAKNVFVVGLVAAMLVMTIGCAVAVRPTVHIGGDVSDEVTLQGRNLPEVTLGIGPQETVHIWGQTVTTTRPTVHLGIGPQEEVTLGIGPQTTVQIGMGYQSEVTIGGQTITEEELAKKIAALWGGQ